MLFFDLHLCVCICVHSFVTQDHMWRSQDSLKEVIPISCYVGSRDRYQVTSVSSKFLYPLIHICNSHTVWFSLALIILSCPCYYHALLFPLYSSDWRLWFIYFLIIFNNPCLVFLFCFVLLSLEIQQKTEKMSFKLVYIVKISTCIFMSYEENYSSISYYLVLW